MDNKAGAANETAEGINSGDEGVFAGIMERHAPPLLNFIYSYVRNRQDAEDITQEVFFRLWKKRKNYRPSAKLSTYLYRIAVNLCIDHKRKKARTPHIYSIDAPVRASGGDFTPEIKDSGPSSEEIIRRKEEQNRIERALSKLPAKQRLALTLRTYEGRNYQEIAEILRCSKSAVESILFRARQNLKKTFGKN